MAPGRRDRRSRATPVDTPAVTSTPREPRWAPPLVLVVFAGVWLSLATAAGFGRSATYDEPLHLVSGYAAVAAGDFRLDPSHPPLVRMWAALPVYLSGGPPLDTSTIDQRTGAAWLASQDDTTLARRFLYRHDADRMLRQSRSMIMMLALGLGVVLFCWTYEWLGLRAAILALGFYAVTPTLMAHGTLVTTDLGVTTFAFSAVYFLWRTCRAVTILNVALLATAVAASTLTKFSGLALGPLIVVLLVLAARRGTAVTPRAAIRIVAVLAAVGFAAIWAAYGFRFAPSGSPEWLFRLHADPTITRLAPTASLALGWLDSWRLLPNAFTQGLLYCVASSVQPAYLMGEYSASGWWYYFPVAFLVKTPVSLLLLFVAGLFVCLKRREEIGRLNAIFTILPLLAFAAVAIASRVNIGVRHLLPAYPFVLMIAGAAAERFVASRAWIGRTTITAVLLIWVIDVATVYPSTLTYFNFAMGGPRNGLEYLADSNLDWGQSLPALKNWMARTGVRHVNLAYFGQADPAYYGIDCTYLPTSRWTARRVSGPPTLPGFVAISATTLSGVYLPPPWRIFYGGFDRLQPVATVGNSINVYWVETWPDADPPAASQADDELALAEELLLSMAWPAHAIAHYEHYLQLRPDDLAARLRLTTVLMDTGRAEAAVQHAGLLAAQSPRDAQLRRLLGRTLELQGRLPEAATEFERAVNLEPSAAARQDLDRVRSVVR